jgi:hypothetical protein
MVTVLAEPYVLSGMYVPLSAGDVAMSGVAGVKMSNATAGDDVDAPAVAVIDNDNFVGRRTAVDPTLIVIPELVCDSETPVGRLDTPFHVSVPVFGVV